MVEMPAAVELDGCLELHDRGQVALGLRVRQLLHRRVQVVDVRLSKQKIVFRGRHRPPRISATRKEYNRAAAEFLSMTNKPTLCGRDENSNIAARACPITIFFPAGYMFF